MTTTPGEAERFAASLHITAEMKAANRLEMKRYRLQELEKLLSDCGDKYWPAELRSKLAQLRQEVGE